MRRKRTEIKGLTCSGQRLSNDVHTNNIKRISKSLTEIKEILDDVESELELVKQDVSNVQRNMDGPASHRDNSSYYCFNLLRARLVRR